MSTETHIANDDEIDLMALLEVVWNGKLWIGLVTAFALALGAFAILIATPVYKADGLLQLEEKSSGLGLPSEMLGQLSTVSPSTTEIEILRSRLVLGQVVDDLALDVIASPRRMPILGDALHRLGIPEPGWDSLAPYAWGGEEIQIGELVVPDYWIDLPLIVTMQEGDTYQIELPDGRRLRGEIRQRLVDHALGLALRIDALSGAPGRQFEVIKKPKLSVIRNLRERFSVTETARDSSILRIELNDTDRSHAVRVLDAIAQSYVAQNVSRSSAEAQRSLEFITDQMPKAEQAVVEAQDELNSYRQQQRSVDLTYETGALLERVTQIEQKLNALVIEEEQLKERYTVNHPTYQALLTNRAKLEEQLDDLRVEAGGLPETQKEIFNLTRNLEVAQQVYVQLLNRVQELQVLRASSIGSVRIIDTAQVSPQPVSPRRGRILALSALLGLMLGTGLVLGRHLLRRGVRGGEELEQIGLPVFATVNFSEEAVNHRKTRGDLAIMALERPDDLVIEALRSLRTSLHFGMLDAKTKSVLLTSSAPGTGKSFTAVNLGVVAAQAGQKVCVIDADLRRGYLRRYFGVEKNRAGLAELLSGARNLADVLVPGPVENLSFIASGRFPPNPSELLMRSDFAELIERLDADFDLIIIDSPPALAVTDPVVMSRVAGASIIVVRHMETAIGEVEAVRRMFETAGSKISGAVLNGYDPSVVGSRDAHYAYNYRYSYAARED
ncbi:polysaccharide biosynthesis tyrosine autokinase [Pontibaca salina]|uniref:Polysaccharide biosynthesis tyrosine autokinase n=1 Tax=Pontibaca salina TaxID=2795731 RepID=A0A934HME5_9RHOB|nr:polysaccharide biosynthesis tyrosine autokinase [Pontibaca salina]MBI6630768.1 polysaccharide biosynthesis tyrosine autokinase [Pontibaca salina]